jgi:hypothetical protein
MAKCPAHEDRVPSLSIKDTDSGKVLVRCQAGCDQADVIAAPRSRGIWNNDDHRGGPSSHKNKRCVASKPDQDAALSVEIIAFLRRRPLLIERRPRSGRRLGAQVNKLRAIAIVVVTPQRNASTLHVLQRTVRRAYPRPSRRRPHIISADRLGACRSSVQQAVNPFACCAALVSGAAYPFTWMSGVMSAT